MREPAALETLRGIGGDWVAALTTAVLDVPSAVIPVETNFLLNPGIRPSTARDRATEEPLTDLRPIVRKSPAG